MHSAQCSAALAWVRVLYGKSGAIINVWGGRSSKKASAGKANPAKTRQVLVLGKAEINKQQLPTTMTTAAKNDKEKEEEEEEKQKQQEL